MTLTKATKVQTAIDKARAKLAKEQGRIKELEAKRTALENDEIVVLVRGLNMPLEKLSAFLESMKSGTHHASGQNGPKQPKITSNENKVNKPEDKQNET